MTPIHRLLENNRTWAADRTREDPQFFTRLSGLQRPEFMWIGCSDSRVPANQITGTEPGEVFVQRNVANLVVNTDINLLSVLEYAVSVLEVQHVIVCGHYGCGGISAAMTHRSLGVLDVWLKHVKDTWRMHEAELLALPTDQARNDRLCELNVLEGVRNLTKTSVVQRAWKKFGRPHLHGWVYGLSDGLVKPLIDVTPGTRVDDIYRYDDEP
jgi:carbonic anhydrase